MPFIPHTDQDVREMLAAIGVPSIDALFDEIPAGIRAKALAGVPEGRSEMEMLRLMGERASQDAGYLCFIGAGSYDHHIPAAVWDIAARGEFMTAYTPYQAEASQGTLQLIYEYQSMMTALTGMDVSNASVYDGGSGLSEAVLMAVRANRKSKSHRVLVAQTLSPFYRIATQGIVSNQNIEIDVLGVDETTGIIDTAALDHAPGDYAALVIAQPNFFGRLEDVDALTDWAQSHGMLVIAVVNALALSVLKPPAQWGAKGADIACGDGQPFGIPMSSGGPSFGFLCTRQELVRQMPGRIVGRTVDLEGRTGFALTLQAREQHIRRAKATSNICTNQGLLVTAGTIHMAMLGADGLAQVAGACHANTRTLVRLLTAVGGVTRAFDGPNFHECVIRLPEAPLDVLEALADRGVLGGMALGDHYPFMEDSILVCATEKRTNEEMQQYARALAEVLGE